MQMRPGFFRRAARTSHLSAVFSASVHSEGTEGGFRSVGKIKRTLEKGEGLRRADDLSEVKTEGISFMNMYVKEADIQRMSFFFSPFLSLLLFPGRNQSDVTGMYFCTYASVARCFFRAN